MGMFNIFKKKSEKQKLQDQYGRLMVETHELSHVYKRRVDSKYQEADRIMSRIKKMD